MTQLRTDDIELVGKLVSATEPLELLDARTGIVVGQFLPSPASLHRSDDECPIDATELSRRYREEGGRPLVEIWKSLEQR